ncbi:MAG: ribosome biogenesis GTP-binding protein YihA/YsxC [bacterium]|nr:ribosome biogenesis GTP-binding protein YihA/YsxC [bacterium]
MNYNNVFFETSVGTDRQLIQSDLPEICFSGRSNVGKSSLINKVLSRKSIARVSTKPGKTVTINFFRLENLRLCDLPGYGYAKVAFSERQRWSDLMETYFNSERNIKHVFQLVDIRHNPTEFDEQMIEFLIHEGFEFTVVLTKSDKLNKTQLAERMEFFNKHFGMFENRVCFVPFSAHTGEGIDKIRKIIEEISQRQSEE